MWGRRGMTRPVISFIIPALDEAATLSALLRDLAQIRVAYEVIVVDGGSVDATPSIAVSGGATVVVTSRGRGRQLRAGAAAARASVFCFLHADVRLDARARAALERALSDVHGNTFAFSLRIAAVGWLYRIVERGTALRSHVAGLPYGDQGLVVSRAAYMKAGGFPDIPLMEDVALVRALRPHTRLRVLPECIQVSSRRWEQDGVIRRTMRNWLLLARYSLGSGPELLADAYPTHSGASAHQARQSARVSMSRRSSSNDTSKSAARAADSVAESVSAVLHGMPRKSVE